MAQTAFAHNKNPLLAEAAMSAKTGNIFAKHECDALAHQLPSTTYEAEGLQGPSFCVAGSLKTSDEHGANLWDEQVISQWQACLRVLYTKQMPCRHMREQSNNINNRNNNSNSNNNNINDDDNNNACQPGLGAREAG